MAQFLRLKKSSNAFNSSAWSLLAELIKIEAMLTTATSSFTRTTAATASRLPAAAAATLALRLRASPPCDRSISGASLWFRRGVHATTSPTSVPDALVVGAYRQQPASNKTAPGTSVAPSPRLSTAASGALDVSATAAASVAKQLAASRFDARPGQVRLLYDLDSAAGVPPITAVMGLGAEPGPEADAATFAEASRLAAAASVRALAPFAPQTDGPGPLSVAIEAFFGNARAAAEGATLAGFKFTRFRSEGRKAAGVVAALASGATPEAAAEWDEGVVLASAQNLARELSETPSNHLPPRKFAQSAREALAGLEGVEVLERDADWIEAQRMGLLMAVARGSAEAPRVVEIVYRGAEDSTEKPIALVGKGVTFDSGGISIKPSAGMASMKGDMGGAAAVLAAMVAVAKLRVRRNVVAVIPLAENMPDGTATRPGDVVTARSGLTVEIDNTDAEGRLILADALHYAAETHKPWAVVELSTLTGAIDVALGSAYAAAFTASDALWGELEAAGRAAGDPFWRMPMAPVSTVAAAGSSDGDTDSTPASPHAAAAYGRALKDATVVADLCNVGGGRSGGACTAAAFLARFVPPGVEFAHLDIAGVFENKGVSGCLGKGMTGRPVRSVVEFVRTAAQRVDVA
ncbi:hypothetical protein HK405_007967, partial [Cladochytrium tenue]